MRKQRAKESFVIIGQCRANQRAAYRGDHSKGTEKRKLSGNPETAAASAYWSSSPDESSDRKTV